jgi:hypothetical protein
MTLDLRRKMVYASVIFLNSGMWLVLTGAVVTATS